MDTSTLSKEDQAILSLIEATVEWGLERATTDLDQYPSATPAKLIRSRIHGMSGVSIDNVPRDSFQSRMIEAAKLLESGILPESLCKELRSRWCR